jgi:NADPH-dependent curcumin reductase CurA
LGSKTGHYQRRRRIEFCARRPERPNRALSVVIKRARMQGFIVLDYAGRFSEAIGALAGWLAEGRLTQNEDIAIGLENAPQTLKRLFTGENFGKQLLKMVSSRILRAIPTLRAAPLPF